MEDIFVRMITSAIEEVKSMSGIDFTEDCIVFMCDHDISNKDFKNWVEKTNDKALVDRLATIID